jgi:lactate 2-monooxygenase
MPQGGRADSHGKFSGQLTQYIREISTTLFGKVIKSPIICAPIGVQNIMHKDAETATAEACANIECPMVLSTAATRTIEEVAEANGLDGERWFQLYWPRPQDEEVTLSLLKRAKDSGFRVLVVTLDTFNLAWRPNDLDHGYLPFIWGDGCQIGLSDPVFNQRYEEQRRSDTRSVSQKISEAWEIMRRPGTVTGAFRVLKHVHILAKSQAWLGVLNSGTYRTCKQLCSNLNFPCHENRFWW